MSLSEIVLDDVRPADIDGIVALDSARGGDGKRSYWERQIGLAEQDEGRERVALVARGERGEVCGFLFGEVRAWEFGSEPCGWILVLTVGPDCEREGLGTRLCAEAGRRFRALGVDVVRTMIRREDVPMLALFRSMGYVAGPYSELERRIGGEPA